ncbi:DUF6176 family protein [Mucilaginibacter sp. UYCu711]|uniref:DUF6176 family protein n=1 Tax=Mucilaginibacter sp. UYCu711 TaxID=3156339 RepID=UPI003D22E5C8
MNYKSIFLVLLGTAFGVILTTLANSGSNFFYAAKAESNPLFHDKTAYPVKATLYRFSLNPETMPVYQEWVNWHHSAYQPMIKTLERERMYYESVFRDTVREPHVIYWLTVSAEGGKTSVTSAMSIDKKHNEYMKQILVKGSRSVLKTEFTLMPDFIEHSIAKHQSSFK